MQPFLTRKEGMSLLELTFAAGVLALALSLLFGSLLTITIVSRLNEDRAVANTALASVLEQVRGLNLQELLEFEAPRLQHPGVKRALALVCYDAAGEEVPIPLVEDDDADDIEFPNPLEVKATLLWSNEQGHVFQSSATLLVGR